SDLTWFCHGQIEDYTTKSCLKKQRFNNNNGSSDDFGAQNSPFRGRQVDGLIQRDIRGLHPRFRESRMRVNSVGELGSRQFGPHCSRSLTDQFRGVRSHDLSPQQLIAPRIGDPLDEAHLITKRKGLSQGCEWKFSRFDLPSLALRLLFAQAHG